MSQPSLLQNLKSRKIVQWALAYLAGAWLIFQAIEVVAEPWSLSIGLQRTIHIVVLTGLPVTLVLAWYHGEKGRQRVSGPELLMLAMLFLLGGIGLSLLERGSDTGPLQDRMVDGEVEDVAAALNRLPGIAVLPFANRSGVPEDRFFVDGIQDELLTRLQRVPGLRVISRTSTAAYRDTDKAVLEIGRELNVGYVLEGGVQRAGDRVRINVQLVDARNEGHLWAETYDRILTPDSVLDLQSEIVRTVAGELNVALRSVEWARSARMSTSDLEAYDLYTRAVGLRDERPEEALALFQRAVDRDPGFVGAWVGLATGHSRAYQYLGLRSEERAAAARAAAERAVELAPQSEDAQLAMGIYLYRVEKAYESALDWLIRASGTLVGDLTYHRFRALTERRMGRWRDAIGSFEAAVSLSPRSAPDWHELGFTYLCMRRYADAGRALQESQRLDPGGVAAFLLIWLGWARDGNLEIPSEPPEDLNSRVYAWQGAMSLERFVDAAALLEVLPDVWISQYWWFPRPLLEAETFAAQGQLDAAREKYREAVAILEPRVREAPNDERYHSALARALAGLDRRTEAIAEARRAVEIMPRERDALGGPDYLFNLAAVYARLGDVDRAVQALEELLGAPARYSPDMLEDHYLLHPIRDDPEFRALMDRERGRAF